MLRAAARTAGRSGRSGRGVVGVERLQGILLDGGVGFESLLGAPIAAERCPLRVRPFITVSRGTASLRILAGSVGTLAGVLGFSSTVHETTVRRRCS